MRKISALALAAPAVALAIAACGSSSSSSSTSTSSSAPASPATTSTAASTPATSAPATSTPSGGAAASVLSLAANPSGQLKYDKSTLSAKAGKVTIAFTNPAPLSHNVTIQQGTGSTGATVGATATFQGGTKTLTVTLKPGTYTFYCSVPGHRAAGMHGTLTVT
jgi:plastocyanin